MAASDSHYLPLVNPGWMPLTVEVVQAFANGSFEVSVCHYGEQNGDAMRDPERMFHVTTAEAWQPLIHRNDYVGLEHWCASVTTGGVAVVTKAKLECELLELARMFDQHQASGISEGVELKPIERIEASTILFNHKYLR